MDYARHPCRAPKVVLWFPTILSGLRRNDEIRGLFGSAYAYPLAMGTILAFSAAAMRLSDPVPRPITTLRARIMLRPFNGRSPHLADTAWVDATALVIGDVALAEDVSVWPMAVIRGDINSIRIGARSNVQDGTVIHVTHDGPYTPGGHPTSLGMDVTIGHRAVIHGCTVGNRVLIGMGAILMDAVEVADDVMIAANALVPPGKRLESGRLYVGTPARAVRELTAAEREQLLYSARHYAQLKELHRQGA